MSSGGATITDASEEEDFISLASSEDSEIREFRQNSCDWFYSHLRKRLHDFRSAKVIKSVGFNNARDAQSSDVRDHIEKLVESLVGDNIDAVSVARICQHPSYDRLFSQYHSKLSDCLSDLVNAIHKVMKNDPLDDEETPTSAHATLKTLVDKLIQDTVQNPYIKEVAQSIGQSASDSAAFNKQYNDNQMFLSESYEELLATVIINKVVTRWSLSSALAVDDLTTQGSHGNGGGGEGRSGRRHRHRHGSNDNPSRCSSSTKTSDSACSSDFDCYKGSNNTTLNKQSSRTPVSIVISPASLSDQDMASRSASGSRMSDSDDGVSGESAVNEQWREQQYLIEEEIEEVTEYDEMDEEQTKKSERQSTKKVYTTKTSKPITVMSSPDPAISCGIDCLLAEICLENSESTKVPFPEFGVDIVVRKADDDVLSECSSDDSSSCSSDSGSGSGCSSDSCSSFCIKADCSEDHGELEDLSGDNSALTCSMRTNEWEDNWLFRRKKSSNLSQTSLRTLSLVEGVDYVPMLIPNPEGGVVWRPKIGHKDIDQVSEISEHNSEASLDLASLISNSSCDEDDHLNSQQKDVEYTEYSVLPLRRYSKCFEIMEESLHPGDLSFKVSPQNVEIEVGKTASFTCTVEGQKPIDISWLHGSDVLKDIGDRVEIVRRRNIFFLNLYNIQPDDHGTYACMAVNPTGEKCQHFNLSVNEACSSSFSQSLPSINCKFQIPIKPLEDGKPTDLKFEVIGAPEARVLVLKNNQRLQPNEYVDIVRTSPFCWTLKLLKCKPRDAGTYEIRAINSLGSAQKKVKIEIQARHFQSQSSSTKSSEATKKIVNIEKSQENMKHRASPFIASSNSQKSVPMNLKLLKQVERPVDHKNLVRKESTDQQVFDRPTAQPGTIADREHRKWTEQAITLQNNPYSRESIARRLARGFLPENTSLSTQKTNLDSSNPIGFSDTSSDVPRQSSLNEIIISDFPRRIDCGPKSSNVSRYRRDYYVHSSNQDNNDVAFTDDTRLRKIKSGDGVGPQGELIERTKALLMSKLTLEDEMRRNSEKSLDQMSQDEVTRSQQELFRSDFEEDRSTDSEIIMEGVDDQGVQDSGVGSSCEKSSLRSKVGSEIQRFQREIERAAEEKSREQEWERRKASRIGSSMDSLLSVEDLPLDTKMPSLPPKGKFVSTGCLVPPLPPKQRSLASSQKRVSISTDEVRVIGIGSFSDESADERRHSLASTNMSFMEKSRINFPQLHEIQPCFSRQPAEGKRIPSRRSSMTDIPSNLPSVRELATKFLVKEIPEPLPRKKRIDSPMVISSSPFQFKMAQPSFEIHSLTARSVPRQFREGLKKSMPEKSDRNIKFPKTTPTSTATDDTQTSMNSDLTVSARGPSFENEQAGLNIIYDNQKDKNMPYTDGDFFRTPSPEHVGIPAGPLRIPPRSGAKTTIWEECTSDESNASPPRSRHPPQNRRKKSQQI